MTNFTPEPRFHRSHLIGIALVLVAFTALILGDYYNRMHATDEPAEIVRRWRTVELGYCTSADVRPCVVAFSRTDDGMLVNLLLPTASYPDFYLTVRRGESPPLRYECRKDEDNPHNAQCAGAEMLPGEALHFTLIALDGNTLLAEGRFAIIGLMLFTPELEPTATPPVTLSPAETKAPTSTRTPTSTVTPFRLLTPTSPATPTAPAYPNPSYP